MPAGYQVSEFPLSVGMGGAGGMPCSLYLSWSASPDAVAEVLAAEEEALAKDEAQSPVPRVRDIVTPPTAETPHQREWSDRHYAM